MKTRVIAIVGPTASGKSRFAIRLAKSLGGEIVSADSRQVYSGLDIGSGKVTRAEQRTIPHYLLDVAPPRRVYTAAHFMRDGKRAIENIRRNGHVPIVVGGTGFWIDALLRGLQLPPVAPNPALRKRLARLSTAQLYARLRKLDPVRARAIDRHNPVRLIRALEIVRTTKRPVPRVHREHPYEVLWLGLRPAARELQRNIHVRLLARVRQGMVAEVRRLLARGVPAQRLLDLGLEYRFVTLFLQKKISRAQMLAQLERAIRHYAKRQMTWFKKNPDIVWVRNRAAAIQQSKRWLTA